MNTKIKNMIIIARVAGALLSSALFVACVDDIKFGNSFLEKAPGVDVNVDTIFVKGENAKAFLWSLYGSLNNPFTEAARIGSDPTEVLSDICHTYNTWGKPYYTYYEGTITEAVQEPYGYDKFPFLSGGDGNNRNGIWANVRHAWIFIDNIDRVPDLSAAEKSQLKGEALVIMACRYIDAFKNFGGLPCVDRAYLPDETPQGRATVEETVKFIDGLLTRAIAEEGLKWNVEDQETWAGRITKGAAYAMRAELWLFAASPLFNSAQPYRAYEAKEKYQNPLHSWLGSYKPEYWTKVVEVCEAFFNENKNNGDYYALIQPAGDTEADYRKAFRDAYWKRGNREKIIEVHSAFSASEWSGIADPRGSFWWGNCSPTAELMEMFPMADGRNFPYANIYGSNNPANVDIFEGRDPRMYETLVVPTPKPLTQWWGMYKNVQLWEGGDWMSNSNISANRNSLYASGMGPYKWVGDNMSSPPTGYPLNYAYLRMADMHLIYAEALAETGNKDKALEEINKVRARVGLGELEKMNPSLNLNDKDVLIAEIMRERACEFAYEDTRLYDIIRRKMTERFSTPLNEIVVWRKKDGAKWEKGESKNLDFAKLDENEPWPDFIYEKRQIKSGARSWWRNWDNKWLLSPLPRSEIFKEYGLTQNPGW